MGKNNDKQSEKETEDVIPTGNLGTGIVADLPFKRPKLPESWWDDAKAEHIPDEKGPSVTNKPESC